MYQCWEAILSNYLKHPIFMALGGFLAAWAGSNFDLDYRAILFAVLAGVFGYAKPSK
jgi:hypothetical protein